MLYLKLFKSFNEGKLNDIQLLYTDKLSYSERSWLHDVAGNSSIYLLWLFKTFSSECEIEDFEKDERKDHLKLLIKYFKKFIRYKSALPKELRDITKISGTTQLIEVINSYNLYDDLRKSRTVTLIAENDYWIIFKPHSFAASKKYGDPEFCTVYDATLYNIHNRNNNCLIYIMDKMGDAYTKNAVIEKRPDTKGYFYWTGAYDVKVLQSKDDIIEFLYELKEEHQQFPADEIIKALNGLGKNLNNKTS